MKIDHFSQLRVWTDSLSLAKEIYLLTSFFPKEEKFGITSQIRRASSSIGANIAEGFGRYHQKEKIQFLLHSRGSLYEVEHFLYLCSELDYVSKEDVRTLIEKCEKLKISIHSYLKQLNLFR